MTTRSPSWDETPGLKHHHDQLVGEVRGALLSNTNRDQRKAARQTDPQLAEQVEGICDALDNVNPKSSGVRPKGAKSRPPDVICRERILRTINGLGEKWMKRLADKSPYLFVQLVKRVLPGTRPIGPGDPAAAPRHATMRITFDDDDEHSPSRS